MEEQKKPVQKEPAQTADPRPAESKPAEQKPVESRPAEPRPVGQKPAASKPAGQKPAGQKPVEARTVSDVLQTAQIALDSYDDIFSDFDPSPYETRLLSDDFLNELRRRHAEKRKGEFVVNFSLPGRLRSEKTEALVRKRIKDYFRGRLRDVDKAVRDRLRNGMLRLLAGALVSLSLIVFPQLDVVPALTLISVLIWYVLWSGFENIFEASGTLKRKHIFYEKFMRAGYTFMDQEEVIRSIGISSSYR